MTDSPPAIHQPVDLSDRPLSLLVQTACCYTGRISHARAYSLCVVACSSICCELASVDCAADRNFESAQLHNCLLSSATATQLPSTYSHSADYCNCFIHKLLVCIYTVSQKNWATFLRPITVEILNRSLPNLAQIKVSSFGSSCQSLLKSILENSRAIWRITLTVNKKVTKVMNWQ